MANCLAELGETKQAYEMLVEPSRSDSPIIGAMANREQALLAARAGRYLMARRRAYAAIGLLGAMSSAQAVELDCEYLIGLALTAEVASASGDTLDLLWDGATRHDPFAGKADVELRRMVREGSERLIRAASKPYLRRRDDVSDTGRRWMAAWSGPLLEELLHRLGAESNLDVEWVAKGPEMRRRAITILFTEGASEQKLAEVACGAAGLLARFTGEKILIHNPMTLRSSKRRRALLGKEGISLWRRFFLRAPEDSRVATGQYALGRLYESIGESLDALRTYQVISRRHWRSPVGAKALLRSAQLRIQLRDYAGARADLLELLDKHPESDLFGEVYLKLGEATRKAGMLDEATRIFERLYTFDNISPETTRQACLETTLCLQAKGDYAGAAEWARRNLELARDSSSELLAEAYLLMGRSAAAAGELDDAALALQQAVATEGSPKHTTEAMLALVPVQVQRERFVHALGLLNRLRGRTLTPETFGKYLVLAARAYRTMGLPRKGVQLLRKHIPSIQSQRVASRLRIELGRSLADIGRLADARGMLAQAVMQSQGDPEGYKAQCELAELSLRMGETDQAIATAEGLLKSSCSQEIRQEAVRILGDAYLRQGEYERAVEAFSELQATRTGGKADE